MHDPTDPVGRLLFNSKTRGRKPKLTPADEALLVELHETGESPPTARKGT